MKATITADEFLDWQAAYRLEPFGDEWRQAAMVAHVAAIAGRLTTRGGGKLSENDFMPVGYVSSRNLPTPDELDKKLMTVFSAMAGKKESK